MKINITTTLTQEQKEAIRKLWNEEYPARIAHSTPESFQQYLDGISNSTHYLLEGDNTIQGWAVTFEREGEQWFAIILSSSVQGKGHGTQLLNMLKEKEPILNGWVVEKDGDKKQNGGTYLSPLQFYTKHGFETIPSVRIENEKISAVKITWNNAKQT